MLALRHSAACLIGALLAGPAAHAQLGAVKDIEVSREGDKISILVQLSQQPAAAAATASSAGLVLEVDGIDLTKLTFDPPAGSLLSHVDAGGRRISLTGAAFSNASTIVYRNAVLIETRLAEPPSHGASLMPRSAVTLPPPQVLEETSAPKLAEPHDGLDSRPDASRAPKSETPAGKPLPARSPSIAQLADIDEARCASALGDLAKDQWSLAALGDHGLCLLSKGKFKEAANRLDQLAAFAPEDWRVALGRAVIASEKGEASIAEIGYRTAAMLAPHASVREAIATLFAPAKGH